MNHDSKTLNQIAADKSIKRIKSLLAEGCSYREICDTLTAEGYLTIKGKPWQVTNLKVLLFRLRHQWASFYGLSQRRAGLVLGAAA